jgi:hypothetical protein
MPSIVSPQLSKALHTFRCKLSLWVPELQCQEPVMEPAGAWGMLGVGVAGYKWLPENVIYPEVSTPPQYDDQEIYDHLPEWAAAGSCLLDTGMGPWSFVPNEQKVTAGGAYYGDFQRKATSSASWTPWNARR